MFPAQFDYRRARSPEEAVSSLAELGDDARILAGGQSLIPAMRYRLARPAVLIDINPIEELAYVREVDGYLCIGATARDYALETSPLIDSRYPLISDTSALVADPVVRQMGTVVGSLCHNDPAGDWPVTALAARAELVLQTKAGARTCTIDEFLVDSYSTSVGTGEMVSEVRFPTPDERTKGAFHKIERKVGDFATASAAARIRLNTDGTIADAGIAVGAVGPKALRVSAAEQLLKGAKPSKDAIAAAAREAEKIADPTPDNRGSVAYKKAMAGVLVSRALYTTFERLGVGGLK